jgi:protein Tex
MTTTHSIDLGHVARDLGLPAEKVARTLELLDEGNTVPFITRYRKDQTGGLDEEQIREIQFRASKVRQLAERKATILKTIEAQGKLTPELAEQIQHANTPKRLEDLYLPFKPKKQTLATIAREKGLEPLAIEIYEARPEAADIQARAAAFISTEKELSSVEEVLAGVGHLIAERFSENPELRGRLRRIFQRTGKIVCTKVEPPPSPPEPAAEVKAEAGAAPSAEQYAEGHGDTETRGQAEDQTGSHTAAVPNSPADETVAAISPESTETSADALTMADAAENRTAVAMHRPNAAAPSVQAEEDASENAESPSHAASEAPSPDPPPAPGAPVATEKSSTSDEASTLAPGRLFEPPPTPVAAPLATVNLKKKKKKKKKVVGEHAFKDYYNYVEPLGRVPPHRVLAINRGERAHAIRVKIEADAEAMFREAEDYLIFRGHPHGDFICNCIRDSLTRLIMPSMEREVRREMTERSEEHAVDVFVRNLRKLLLQPPSRGRRVLAVDPGFKSGSKMAALDEFGNVLGHGMVFVIGKDEERRKRSRTRLSDMVKQHGVSVIAIGNGTGCRETEQLVAECLSEELKDQDAAYVIVNEAGASIYSTSPLGREELPQFDALQRGAISIGRRLLDPLSEMVKIHPANLGVGLYQHDIKAKHLKDSLDAVVESCVNFVGVDVNSASPALLRYVSGMNALTARRVYEYRREKGPFKNREELKLVPGFGEQTFVQAAGFLKVIGGENPLDATWIHPESYDTARRVLDKLGCDVADLAKNVPAPVKEEPKKEFGAELQPEAEATITEQSPQGGEVISESTAAQQPATGPELSTEYSALSTAVDSPSLESIIVQATSPELGETAILTLPEAPALGEASAAINCVSENPSALPFPLSSAIPPPEAEASSELEAQTTPRSVIAERAANVDAHQLAAELSVGTHLLEDILTSLTRPALDPRDDLPPPVFRRGIMKLEDLAAGMELSGTVLNVVDFGVFVDIGLSDSGLVHISRLADRFIRDPHEVVGVGDVLKVWVVDVDKARRRVSLTAIAPGSERPARPPREKRERQPRPQQQRPQQERQQQRPPRPPRQPQPHGGPPQADSTSVGPPQGDRPPRSFGGGRRDRHGGRGRDEHPKTIERPPTKPKKIKPLTKAMEEGKEPLRSFSDLLQLYDKKKDKPKGTDEPPAAPTPG